MTRKIAIITVTTMLLLAPIGTIAASTAVASAQSANQPVAASGSSVPVSNLTWVESWEYREGNESGGRFIITLGTDVATYLTVVGQVDPTADRESGTAPARGVWLSPSRTTTIEIGVDRDRRGEAIVTLATKESLEEGQVAYLSTKQDESLIPAPYTESDLWYVGVGVALFGAVTLLVVAVRARLGADRRPRRLA